MAYHLKKSLLGKRFYVAIAIFFILVIILILSYLTFEKIYAHKIYPGIYLGNINLSGYTKAQAKNLLNQKIDYLNQRGLIFRYHNRQATLMPLVASVESDLAYQIINFDVEKTVNQIYNFGRKNNIYYNLNQKIYALLFEKSFRILFVINEEEVKKTLINNFSDLATPAQDAKITYATNQYKPYLAFVVEEEKLGQLIEYDQGIKKLQYQLAKLDDSPIFLSARIDYPEIYKKDCLNIATKAMGILNQSPLSLTYDKDKWEVKQNQLVGWLTLKINKATTTDDKVMVSLHQKTVENFLRESIALEINREAMDAKFEIKNGRVVEFQASHDGLELNPQASFSKIEYELVANKNNQIELVTRELKSIIHTEDINDLGIKEIVGIGESSFAGSPQNRRHNIRIGANTLNGILIKPDEEFSLNKALGEIDKKAGYLPELVIKDNKTTPEYGGGLCQIGTTMFRVALATGLPITMRRNHSYRVFYYEPAGTDATIYNPWPDFKFINNTGHYILIQSRIEGDNLYFDFWGTSDGRVVEQTKPTIYNIVRPGPTKLIETLDLPVGEKKCTERAHNGADTYFDYKVTYADGEVLEKRFSSHYVPWREVCLIGVEELSGEEDKKTATTTEEKIE